MTSTTAHAALERAISPDRLGTYIAAATGDTATAFKLYLWDRDLASAILADIAILEVALRNALNQSLTTSYGREWYRQDVGFDERSRGALTRAWNGLPAARRTPGRVVSQLMFGFWQDSSTLAPSPAKNHRTSI
ncbi:Abi family protein [Jatrophihabitans sp. DSM 45814]